MRPSSSSVLGGDVEETEPFRTVAIIGAGSRGRDFARRCVQYGFEVVLEDVLSSRLRRAEEQFSADPASWRDRLRLSGSVEDAVRTADLAIDFLPDDLESKLEIFSMMDRMAPPKTVFCTPTSLSITDLASCTYRATQCVALLPFDGHESGPEVRLVRGARTSDGVADRVTCWLEALGFAVQASEEEHPSQRP